MDIPSRLRFSTFDENISDEFNLDINDKDVVIPMRTRQNFLPEEIIQKILEKCSQIHDRELYSQISLKNFICYFKRGDEPRNQRFFSGYIINFGLDETRRNRDRFILSPHINFTERQKKKQKTFCWRINFDDIEQLFFRFSFEGQLIMKSMIKLGRRALTPQRRT
jgi:hypothetical protein